MNKRVAVLVLVELALCVALWFAVMVVYNHAHAEGLVLDPYYGWVSAPRGFPGARMPGVWSRHAAMPWTAPGFSYRPPDAPPFIVPPPPPPAAIAPPPEPPPMEGPQPMGWVFVRYAPCADPNCQTLTVNVNVDGLNVRGAPAGAPISSLANGTPLIPIKRVGDWVLVAAACPLVPAYAWSVTANVPFLVCGG